MECVLVVALRRVRYADFRRKGLFVGSGVIEAGCKTIIGQRLKRSGMHWTVRGANAIIALRCCRMSGRWEEFWERSEEHTSELQSRLHLVCRLLLEKKKKKLYY